MSKTLAKYRAQMICLVSPSHHLYMVEPGESAYICKVCGADFDEYMKHKFERAGKPENLTYDPVTKRTL